MADQEAYDVVAHYDPVAGEIVEPLDTLTLDTLNVREITCFKINLDEIVDADADIDNGITVDGDLFMADTSTIQLATVQGVGGAEIDFLDDIAFDTDSGIKFGLGAKLDEYRLGTTNVTWGGAIADTAGTFEFLKLGRLVVLRVPAFSAAYASTATISTITNVLAADLQPATDLTTYALVLDAGAAASGILSVAATGQLAIAVGAGTGFTSGTVGLTRAATIAYISAI